MGGSTGSDQARLDAGYNTGYSGYSRRPGLDPNTIAWEASDLGAANRAGYEAAAAAANQPAFEMPMWEMPDFSSMSSSSDQAILDMQARLDAQAEEARRTAGLANMNEMYSSRMNAANSSVDYINNAINQERSDAALMGIDYNITDEDKTARINNYFASVWGEGDEQSLNALMGEWGAPEGHTEFVVTRGDASAAPQQTEGDSTTVSRSGGMKPKKTAITDEEGLGGGTTVLGA